MFDLFCARLKPNSPAQNWKLLRWSELWKFTSVHQYSSTYVGVTLNCEPIIVYCVTFNGILLTLRLLCLELYSGQHVHYHTVFYIRGTTTVVADYISRLPTEESPIEPKPFINISIASIQEDELLCVTCKNN